MEHLYLIIIINIIIYKILVNKLLSMGHCSSEEDALFYISIIIISTIPNKTMMNFKYCSVSSIPKNNIEQPNIVNAIRDVKNSS